MQLPDFIRKMLGFADRVEKHFTAADELDAARKERDLAVTKLAAVEAELATLKASSTDGAVKITNLNTELSTAKAELQTKTAEVEQLGKDLAAAKSKAATVLAGQGLPADQVPANSEDARNPQTDAWAQYQEMAAKDPRAAGRFYAEHADEILQAKAKAKKAA